VGLGPVETVSRWSGQVATFVEANRGWLAAAAAALVVGALLWRALRRRSSAASPSMDPSVPERAVLGEEHS
jgi:hypothetical protein